MKLSALLLEMSPLMEMSDNATLYHRSRHKFKVGDEIKLQTETRNNSFFEKAMEAYRLEKYPKAPSRQKSVYASVIPRSRFVDKGYLYTVKIKPGSEWLMTDSQLIDSLMDKFDHNTRDYDYERLKSYSGEHLAYELDRWEAERYWSGKIRDTEAIEVLSEAFIVTEVHDQKRLITRGDKVQVTEHIPNVKIECYVNNRQKFSEDLIKKWISKFLHNGTLEVTPGEYSKVIGSGALKAGMYLYVNAGGSPMYKPKSYRKEYQPSRNLYFKLTTKTAAWNNEDKLPYCTLMLNPDQMKSLKLIE